MANILIADDHSMVREALVSRLTHLGHRILGEAADGQALLQLWAGEETAAACDLILLDISMPHKNGLEVAREIKAQSAEQRIMILSTYDHQDYIHSVRAMGIEGYLLKSVDYTEMGRAIDIVLMGGLYFSPPVKARMIAGQGAPQDTLTLREREVKGFIDQGLRSKEIATRLNISTRTVEAHRRNLNRKRG